MGRDFLHNHSEFGELIRIVGDDLSIEPALVEKDYWIMHCLYGLQQLGHHLIAKALYLSSTTTSRSGRHASHIPLTRLSNSFEGTQRASSNGITAPICI